MASCRVEVTVGTPYPVILGAGLDPAAVISEALEPARGVILTDSHVGPLHAPSLRDALEAGGWGVAGVVEVPAGEPSKSLEVYAEVVRTLARYGLRRDDTLFALGGGVVGDLGGFVAATYLRGISLVQLPTSLLAMVDSSVGGKVGLDLPEGKNLLGSFFQPLLVVADLGWLRTLPPRELSCGLAEVVKMGLLSGGQFFDDLRRIGAACSGDTEALRALILDSVRFKARIVAADERESGRRAILNYGHTVGHGLEAAAGFALPHGEAVAAGMVAAAHLAREALGCDLVALHEELLRSAGLPLGAPELEVDAVLSLMGQDKKRRSEDAGGNYRFVLLEDVGAPLWGVQVGEKEARRAVEAVVG